MPFMPLTRQQRTEVRRIREGELTAAEIADGWTDARRGELLLQKLRSYIEAFQPEAMSDQEREAASELELLQKAGMLPAHTCAHCGRKQ